MAQDGKTFAGPVPAIYDRYLVPLIFEGFARDLATRVKAAGPKSIVETAAGTGVLTRAMADALPDATITATDLNQAMIDQAATRPARNGHVTWQQADALSLPLADGSADLVACQFGVMFFPDRVAGHKEARRVLKPGGTLAFNVWDDIASNPFPQAVMDALAEMFANDPPTFMTRIPHGYHDPQRIRADLEAAGFTSVAVETVDGVSRAASARDVAIGFCQGTPMRAEIEARSAGGLEEATTRSAERIERRFGPGAVEAPIRALVVTAS